MKTKMALERISKTEKETLKGVSDGIDVFFDYEYQSGEKPKQIDARAEIPDLGSIRFCWLNNESVKNNLSINTYGIELSKIPNKLIAEVMKEFQGIIE